LGAAVTRNRAKDIGWFEIELLPLAAVDPLFAGSRARETVFQWHGDTFALPTGAVQLARGALCEQQAFRYGAAAYGLQFHPEMTADMVAGWFASPSLCADLTDQDRIDPVAICRRAPKALVEMAPLTARLFGRFAELCKKRDACLS
jgi:GMP synthase-like glutamine amidotransferase